MQLVTKSLTPVRSLSHEEVALMTAFAANTLTGRDVERAAAFLRECRADGHWIACHCSNPHPVMNVALLDSGRLVLRNNPDRPRHTDGCPFSHTDQATTSSRRNTARIAKVQHGHPAVLHTAYVNHAGGPAKPQKAILSLLMTLIEDAGLAVFDPSEPLALGAQFGNVRAAAANMTLNPNVPMERYMDTRISSQRLIGMAKRLRQEEGFKDQRRVGLLMDVVEKVQGRNITLTENRGVVGFFGQHERTAPPSPPLLVLVSVASQQPGMRFFEFGQVASFPVLNRGVLFPVYPGEERKDITQLFKLLEWLNSKGVTVRAIRHVFAENKEGLIELRHRAKIVLVDLRQLIPASDDTGADSLPEDDNLIRLADHASMDTFKRHLAGIFMELK